MFKLFKQVVEKEMADGTFTPRDRSLANQAFGRDASREGSDDEIYTSEK